MAHRVNIRNYGFNNPHPKPDPLSLEQTDCRRHGYVLTNKTLGTGAYAKVKLARVTERKLARNSKLREDLRGKGHDMVRSLCHITLTLVQRMLGHRFLY